MEELIPEYQRDDSLDYLKILKALIEIPFPVGKKLLIDFLTGSNNPSITKNNLDDLFNFDSLSYNKEEVEKMIDNLVSNGLIQIAGNNNNMFMKLLTITSKGSGELMSPTLNSKKLKNKVSHDETIITEKDRELFHGLESILKDYNDEQKKAIISDQEKILCIAGAGSGKTTVLTKRIEFLVRYKAVDVSKILAITFTRKAKEEMISRLKELNIDVKVETFNSFCEKILRKYSYEIYQRPTRMLSYMEKSLAVIGALNSINKDLKSAVDNYFSEIQKKNKNFDELSNVFINDCFFIVDYFKTKNQEVKDFSGDANLEDRSNAEMMYKIAIYLKDYMEIQGLRNFTDQVIDVLKFFRENKNRIPEFEHVLVDEYQDVNSSQIEFLDLLDSRNLFCVGDPRQSIFGWRGSDISYILNFKNKYPNAEIITLKKNYRSNQEIVDFMNHAIRDLGLPDINSHNNENGKIKLMEFISEKEEFDFVIGNILNSNIEREEIFVLARTNRQLRDLSKVMHEHKIKHVVKTDELKRPVFARRGDVTLATIHSIKGLEAKRVFVIGCNQLNFPSKANEHPVLGMVKVEEYDKEEEEKRLFYVAISRAKEDLYLCYSGKKHTYFINNDMLDIIK